MVDNSTIKSDGRASNNNAQLDTDESIGIFITVATVKDIVNEAARPLRLLQISDCHLGHHAGEKLLGLDTDESLQDVLALIRAEQKCVDYLFATGDIADEGQSGAYQRFFGTYVPQLPHPVACLPGNHDCLIAMMKASTGPIEKIIELGPWVAVLLDSRIERQEHGDLSSAELAFLDQQLARYADRHVAIFLHHQPVNVGSAWIDQYTVRSANKFFAVIDRHPNVRMIAWGHVHQDFNRERNGVKLLACPSTCVQFKPLIDEFTVDTAMPGYRWIDLYNDGRVVTGISRVAEKAYGIDFASSGY